MRIRETRLHPRFSSLRESADLFIELDVVQWIKEGKAIYLAPDGVICVFGAIPLRFFLTVVTGRDNHPEFHQGIIPEYFVVRNQTGRVPLMSYYERVDMNVTPPPSPAEIERSQPSAAQSSQPAEPAPAAQDTPVEVEESQFPTTAGLTTIVVKGWGPWTTDFIKAIKHLQRVLVDPGEENFGYMWDCKNLCSDGSWKYTLSL